LIISFAGSCHARLEIIVIGAVLAAALIATTIHEDSDGLTRGGVADQATDCSQQQIQRISPVADPGSLRKLETNKASETEPWGLRAA
jgi:hypothetical protein